MPTLNNTDNAPALPIEAAYAAALDEIYALRAVLACEARILEAHVDYKTFPKSRRQFADASIVRMRGLARGGHRTVYAEGVGSPGGVYRFHKQELKNIGASDSLTKWEFEEGLHLQTARTSS